MVVEGFVCPQGLSLDPRSPPRKHRERLLSWLRRSGSLRNRHARLTRPFQTGASCVALWRSGVGARSHCAGAVRSCAARGSLSLAIFRADAREIGGEAREPVARGGGSGFVHSDPVNRQSCRIPPLPPRARQVDEHATGQRDLKCSSNVAILRHAGCSSCAKAERPRVEAPQEA